MATNIDIPALEGTLGVTRFVGPEGGDRLRLQVTTTRDGETTWSVLNRDQAYTLVEKLAELLEL